MNYDRVRHGLRGMFFDMLGQHERALAAALGWGASGFWGERAAEVVRGFASESRAPGSPAVGATGFAAAIGVVVLVAMVVFGVLAAWIAIQILAGLWDS